jgi:hypothetical protein
MAKGQTDHKSACRKPWTSRLFGVTGQIAVSFKLVSENTPVGPSIHASAFGSTEEDTVSCSDVRSCAIGHLLVWMCPAVILQHIVVIFKQFNNRRSLLCLYLPASWLRTTSSLRTRLLDELFWVIARRVWSRWKQALLVVTPETDTGFSPRGVVPFSG